MSYHESAMEYLSPENPEMKFAKLLGLVDKSLKQTGAEQEASMLAADNLAVKLLREPEKISTLIQLELKNIANINLQLALAVFSTFEKANTTLSQEGGVKVNLEQVLGPRPQDKTTRRG